MKNSITKKSGVVYFILGILFLLFVWFISSNIINNSGVVPTITEVMNELEIILGNSSTYKILGNTFLKILVALIVSFLIGLFLAIIALISEKIEYFIRPFIIFLKSIPIVAIVMILIIMFFKQNVRYIGTIVASSFVMIPILFESILVGFKSIDPWVIKSTKLESKTNFNILMKIHVPLALPNILSGIISSFGMGLKVMVMSEVIMNPNNSLGQLIGFYSSNGEIGKVVAYSILLLVIVVIIDYLLKILNKRINLIEN
ncbi:MAG: ABC transporter permease subunit [Bacilli bacterium]|nr:ABC transporter permease subunit [Bacilli bacterium]